MPYDVTTIGSILGSCDGCGKPKALDVARIAGIAETAGGVFNRLNPFSDDFWVKELARRAATGLEEKADQAAAALRDADPKRAAFATALDGIGIPTWGYSGDLIMGAALVGALAVGGVLIVRAVKKKKSARGALTRKAKR